MAGPETLGVLVDDDLKSESGTASCVGKSTDAAVASPRGDGIDADPAFQATNVHAEYVRHLDARKLDEERVLNAYGMHGTVLDVEGVQTAESPEASSTRAVPLRIEYSILDSHRLV
ncbi:hypothetical protein BWO91_14355 [Plantibacter flavus]|uniref:hypothetical protein n=1 Tax=Plantibacter flavus TaxID=150123 RepID=UPI00099DEA10|nr:hypothetical protein [Plantibacter flavus]AQX80989.1 hypothetical protein BWO91_14355 [Plantibacter flavus]